MGDRENIRSSELESNDSAEDNSSSRGERSAEDDRKLFVGGLNWETTEKDLLEFFSQHGEVVNVNLKIDPMTGRSRGFAFVVFKAVESVDLVLNSGDLIIKGKKVEAKHAKARQGKIFVGGLPFEVTDDEIREHFGHFGRIVDMEVPFDRVRNQRKGYCFITFETDSPSQKLIRLGKQVVGGKEVDVKKAQPRQDSSLGGPCSGPAYRMHGRGFPQRGAFPSSRGGHRRTWGGGWGGDWGYADYGSYGFENPYYGSYQYDEYGGYGPCDPYGGSPGPQRGKRIPRGGRFGNRGSRYRPY